MQGFPVYNQDGNYWWTTSFHWWANIITNEPVVFIDEQSLTLDEPLVFIDKQLLAIDEPLEFIDEQLS